MVIVGVLKTATIFWLLTQTTPLSRSSVLLFRPLRLHRRHCPPRHHQGLLAAPALLLMMESLATVATSLPFKAFDINALFVQISIFATRATHPAERPKSRIPSSFLTTLLQLPGPLLFCRMSPVPVFPLAYQVTGSSFLIFRTRAQMKKDQVAPVFHFHLRRFLLLSIPSPLTEQSRGKKNAVRLFCLFQGPIFLLLSN
jgi:hypothetical protein